MDWYQFAFGRPSPGRRARDRRFRYIDGAEDPQVSNQSDAVDAARAYEPPTAPRWAEDANEARAQDRRGVDAEGIGGAPRVPFSAASGRDVRPFGDDFATWSDSVDAAERPRRGVALTAAPEENAPPLSPARREPDSAPGAERQADLGQEWRDANARAEARWREGRPSHWDMVFAAIYGSPYGSQRRGRVARENDEMRRQLREGDD